MKRKALVLLTLLAAACQGSISTSDPGDDAALTAPLAPTELSAIQGAGADVVLTWTNNSYRTSGFTIQRSTSATKGFQTIASIDASATTYADEDPALSFGSTYYYRVNAFRTRWGTTASSAFTDVASVALVAPSTSDAGSVDPAPGDAGSVNPPPPPPADGGTVPVPQPSAYASQALKMADFLLSQQTADGAIPDYADGTLANEDSNMEYALIGLAAAYWYSHDARYLTGLEHGIAWLAAREEMSDPTWAGSWYYTYQAAPPYAHVATSPGSGVTDVRAVDATSAIFVYLIYLDQKLSGSSALAQKYAANARAALKFVQTRNLSKTDHFSLSSYQLVGGSWQLWPYEYAADEGDVYLGLAAGGLLYDTATDRSNTDAAAFLRANTPGQFFMSSAGRYSIGRTEGGSLDSGFDGFDGIWPQGYLPWMWGASTQNMAAYQWLVGKQQADGSVVAEAGAPKYTLSVAILAMSAASLGQPVPTQAINWLLTKAYDPATGAVRDTDAANADIIDNVVGMSIVGLLGFPSLL